MPSTQPSSRTRHPHGRVDDSGHKMSMRSQLYRGETRLDIIGRRKIWYALSALVIIAGIVSLGVRGLNLSIDFKGGDAFQFAANGHTISQAQTVMNQQHISDPVIQKLGENQIQVTTPVLPDPTTGTSQVTEVVDALATEFDLQPTQISVQSVGSSWGSQITDKAIEGLVIFLVAVALYIAVRFEAKMAAAAFFALIHDLVITAGVYSLVGFSVSPSTVIAILTILGFSLYDTVVVFDRVRENTEDITPRSNRTYTAAANLAVNQTLMRSINTSLIALLPVAALLFVGAGLLGAGTLKDLALAQFVGLAVGAYSSIFIATPLLTQLKEREPGMKELQKRVAFLASHKPSALDAAESAAVVAGSSVGADVSPATSRPGVTVRALEPGGGPTSGAAPGSDGAASPTESGPAPDATPARIPGSPMRQQGPRKRRGKGRPSGKRR
jgi:preprotein translocase subunit SecF